MSIVRDNPNATAVGGVTVLASLVTLGAGLFGWELDPTAAVAIAGALSTVVLFVGRKGVRGIARMLWRGSEEGVNP